MSNTSREGERAAIIGDVNPTVVWFGRSASDQYIEGYCWEKYPQAMLQSSAFFIANVSFHAELPRKMHRIGGAA